jgi:EmrB/QacA subfamily drug resistance transporter
VVFFLTVAAMGLMPLAVTGTNLAFPDIERAFDESSRATLSWALSGYSISMAAFQMLGGQFSDRFNTRKVFLLGLIIFGGASLIAGLAAGAPVLIAGRVLQGIGGALIIPASLVLATAQFPSERHPMVIGVWTAAFPLGSALAPTLTAAALELTSWRGVFFTTTIVSWVLAAIAAPLPIRIPERVNTSTATPDYLGIVVGTASVAFVSAGVVQGPSWGWLSGRTITLLLLGVALVPVFIVRSRNHPRPLLDLDLFKIRSYAVASVANVFISIIGMATWLVWPLVMTNQWGYSRIEVGLAITPTPAIAGTVSILSLRWARDRGYKAMLAGGSAMLAIANIFYVVSLDSQPDYLRAMLPGLVLYGVGMGLTFAPVNAAALVHVPPQTYGQANAGFSTGRFLSGAVGIAATIAALGDGVDDPFAGYDRAFTLLAGASVISVVTILLFWPRQGAAAR